MSLSAKEQCLAQEMVDLKARVKAEMQRRCRNGTLVAYAGTDADTLKNLRVAYVGMSRPRYMLCVAIQQDRFDKIDCEELRKIWKVEKA